MITIQALFAAIHQAPTEQTLRQQVIPQLGQYFASTRQGLFFFDQLPMLEPRLQQVMDRALSLNHNPVVRYITERHAPVHESLVTSPKVWRMICPRLDHWHVMAGPLVNQGQLVGAVGLTREQAKPAFDSQDLADLSAICLHLSTWVAAVKHQENAQKQDCLTPRELEIAELVASGLTNAAIGRELWITENSVKQALKRMFRKLEVSSRAELVAQLFTVTQHKAGSNHHLSLKS
ncbi:helix-turn-helix transcriptional regulator [Acaryochloris marina]|uniref:helix-turn-helix transcriptional regulator n=1 Tax=Acaryochloris marina TaxID=155978 RepID=UPI0021C35C17|nr:LuxR C-terminal-related transcriptional regulator [Acaryochloris marina]BDM78601.1 LuxR family transcriptional regulator [Acaryochloris marina MBIC10699]